MDVVKNNNGNEIFFPSQLFRDENIEFPTGNIFEGYEADFSIKNSKVILKITTKFEIS